MEPEQIVNTTEETQIQEEVKGSTWPFKYMFSAVLSLVLVLGVTGYLLYASKSDERMETTYNQSNLVNYTHPSGIVSFDYSEDFALETYVLPKAGTGFYKGPDFPELEVVTLKNQQGLEMYFQIGNFGDLEAVREDFVDIYRFLKPKGVVITDSQVQFGERTVDKTEIDFDNTENKQKRSTIFYSTKLDSSEDDALYFFLTIDSGWDSGELIKKKLQTAERVISSVNLQPNSDMARRILDLKEGGVTNHHLWNALASFRVDFMLHTFFDETPLFSNICQSFESGYEDSKMTRFKESGIEDVNRGMTRLNELGIEEVKCVDSDSGVAVSFRSPTDGYYCVDSVRPSAGGIDSSNAGRHFKLDSFHEGITCD